MVKLGIVSDLHTEFWTPYDFREIGGRVQTALKDADLILLAGDNGYAEHSVIHARKLFPDKPVCMIAGNHEFYGGDVDTVCEAMANEAGGNIHFLNRTTFTTDAFDTPLRIIGATLWTDFDLFGNAPLSMFQAGLRTPQDFGFTTRYPDFWQIRKGDSLILPQEMLEMHRRDRAWLLAEIDKPFVGKTVVLTHHAPVSFAIRSIFIDSPISPCFASRMEHLLARDDVAAVVWGHTHYPENRLINGTAFLSNQVGYRGQQLGRDVLTETGDFGQVFHV